MPRAIERPNHRQRWTEHRPRFARFVAALNSPGGALRPAPVLPDTEPLADAPARAAPRSKLAAAGRRWTLLISAASAAALALVTLLEPIGGQDRGTLVRPPAEAGLVRAPAAPAPLLVANRPRSIQIGAPVAAKAEPAPAPAARPAPARIAGPVASLAADGKFAVVAIRAGALTGPGAAEDDALYDLGRRLQQKGALAQAIDAYRIAAEANPQHVATYYQWGYLLQQQGDEDGARQKYLMTLQLAPQHPFAHYNLGYLLQKRGDYLDAIPHYQAAIAADPSFFWSYYNLAYIEQQLGQYRKAVADYRKSIEIDPSHALAYENIATILRYHQDH